jgi:hypothetical protein
MSLCTTQAAASTNLLGLLNLSRAFWERLTEADRIILSLQRRPLVGIALGNFILFPEKRKKEMKTMKTKTTTNRVEMPRVMMLQWSRS